MKDQYKYRLKNTNRTFGKNDECIGTTQRFAIDINYWRCWLKRKSGVQRDVEVAIGCVQGLNLGEMMQSKNGFGAVYDVKLARPKGLSRLRKGWGNRGWVSYENNEVLD